MTEPVGNYELWEAPGQRAVHTRRWISELLGVVPNVLDGPPRPGKFQKFPLFIVCDDRSLAEPERTMHTDWFKFLVAQRFPFGLVHVSDENYSHDLSVYHLPGCMIILRAYFRPLGGLSSFFQALGTFFISRSRYKVAAFDLNGLRRFLGSVKYRFVGGPAFVYRQHFPVLDAKKVFFIPAGPADEIIGFCERVEGGIVPRKYLWSFSGDTSKSDRAYMLKCLSVHGPHYVHSYRGFGSSEALPVADYFLLLRSSIFVPCPTGFVNSETYRLYEVLEAGAVPLLVPRHAGQAMSYFQELLGESPLPVFKDWREAARYIAMQDSHSIEQLQKDLNCWYRSYKVDLAKFIRQKISAVACQFTCNRDF